MIQLNDLTLFFGPQAVFNHISYNIDTEHKIGLVGRNGAGKSTLLNAIAGFQKMDDGTISIASSTTLAYMKQDVVLTSSRTILMEVLSARPVLATLLDELAVLEPKVEKNSATEKEFVHYAQLHHDLHEYQFESLKAKAQQMLIGLGFSQEQMSAPVTALSVGWKMRLVLAKLLLQEADFYLFDEPTNHLDLSAKDWFVDFLRNAHFGFMLVSHDKYFLDTVCDHICEISRGKLTCYTGNFDTYIVQKEAASEQLEKKFEQQQKMIQEKTDWVKRNKAQASKARMAQSILKSLAKIDLIEPESEERAVAIHLPKTTQPGKVVLTIDNLSFGFSDKPIFEHASCEILRGHKVALVAPNGTGKSTLLNVVMGKYKATAGTMTFGYNVVAAFFEQDQNKSLNHKHTIVQEIESVCRTSEDRARVRGLLGSFLFSGSDVDKPISVLSGGEKNRVAMVKILLAHANFLILDEPTNHLDLISKEILLNALSQFDGTLLFVSHDRDFLNNLATDIIELTPSGLYHYSGNYDEYLYHKQQIAATATAKVEGPAHKKQQACPESSTQKERRKQVQHLESLINKLEKQHATAVNEFATLVYGDPLYTQKLEELKKLERKIQEQYAAWELFVAES